MLGLPNWYEIYEWYRAKQPISNVLAKVPLTNIIDLLY